MLAKAYLGPRWLEDGCKIIISLSFCQQQEQQRCTTMIFDVKHAHCPRCALVNDVEDVRAPLPSTLCWLAHAIKGGPKPNTLIGLLRWRCIQSKVRLGQCQRFIFWSSTHSLMTMHVRQYGINKPIQHSFDKFDARDIRNSQQSNNFFSCFTNKFYIGM